MHDRASRGLVRYHGGHVYLRRAPDVLFHTVCELCRRVEGSGSALPVHAEDLASTSPVRPHPTPPLKLRLPPWPHPPPSSTSFPLLLDKPCAKGLLLPKTQTSPPIAHTLACPRVSAKSCQTPTVYACWEFLPFPRRLIRRDKVCHADRTMPERNFTARDGRCRVATCVAYSLP